MAYTEGNFFKIHDGTRKVLIARNTNASSRDLIFDFVIRGVTVNTIAVTLAAAGTTGAEKAFGPFVTQFGSQGSELAEGSGYVVVRQSSGASGDVKFSVITVGGP
jgi:hypothetical protein